MTKITIQEHKTIDNEVALLKSTIEKWVNENYEYAGLKISDKPNRDGLYEVSAHSVEVKNRNITSLTNGMFEWKKINDFYCLFCTSLKSLEGAPQKVGGDFYCTCCTSLTSLEGAPEKIGGSFNCSYCPSLTSLVSAPKEVGGYFDCYGCKNLSSLEGAPLTVRDSFYCSYCTSLKSLIGAPKEVGGNFYCYNSKTKFTVDDIRKVSNVKGKIIIIK